MSCHTHGPPFQKWLWIVFLVGVLVYFALR